MDTHMKGSNMSNETGGPAFPSHGSMGEVTHEGATLRDYFAAHASDMDVDSHREYTLHNEGGRIEMMLPTRSREQARYAYADAMIRARGEG